MRLDLDADELAACVGCGLCLPHCPTWRVTGDEAWSPRGRIELMRAVQDHDAPVDEEVSGALSTCVVCRGCESACPSGVPFGHLMEDTRAALVSRQVPWWERLGYRALGRQRLLRFGSTLIAAAQRVGVVPRRLGLPRLPWRRASLTPTGDDVYLFTGCVMDAWQSPVHAATIRVITAAGAGVALPHRGSACCGALHEHAGLRAQARRLAAGVMATMPGTQPIVVNSAGCGAALKDYGRLLGTDEARAFAARVVDVHEWLAPRIDRLSLRPSGISVAVQDPCHLRHVQRTHLAVRTVLGPAYRLVELDDDGLCCGAGGAFSMHHGELAGEIRARKLEAIGRSGAPVVASANPGCSMHLAAAGATVRHPMELIDEVLPSGR